MGCDIHLYSETLDEHTNAWVADTADSFEVEKDDPEDEGWCSMTEAQGSSRNYWLFGVLAGVRTEWPYSFEAKGFPEDASYHVEKIFKRWDCDAHTPSYLTKRELQEKAAELMISAEEGARDNAGLLRHVLDGLDGDPDRQRIVFWFDN